MVTHKDIRKELTTHQQRGRAVAAAREEQRLSPDSAIPAQQARPGIPRPTDASAATSTGGLDMPTRADRKDTPIGSRLDGRAAKPAREPTPHDRRALYGILLVLGILVASIAVSIPAHKNIYIFGYITAIVYATNGPMWRNRPWRELGLKRGFTTDFRRVWYLVAIVVALFQLLPPSFGIAHLFGYYSELVRHMSARLPVTIGSQKGIAALAGLLATDAGPHARGRAGLPRHHPGETELVHRDARSDPHCIGPVRGGARRRYFWKRAGRIVILADTAGIAIDGILFGIIYAKTHNLALTWATHYAADVVGIIALLVIF